MSLPVTVATHPASLSPLALSSSIPHALLLPAASCTFWSPTWLILETRRCPKQETAATLILLLINLNLTEILSCIPLLRLIISQPDRKNSNVQFMLTLCDTNISVTFWFDMIQILRLWEHCESIAAYWYRPDDCHTSVFWACICGFVYLCVCICEVRRIWVHYECIAAYR